MTVSEPDPDEPAPMDGFSLGADDSASADHPGGVPAGFRAGHVALVGRPNVGKSTLLNRLVGEKVAITAPRPQTTRHLITGILSRPAWQIVFVDTPGLHQADRNTGLLARTLNRAARGALGDVDVAVHVVQAGRWTDEDAVVQDALRASGTPTLCALNQIDRVADKTALLPELQRLGESELYRAIVPVSALKNRHIEALEAELVALLPESEPLYPEDQLSTRGTRLLVTEFIREPLLHRLRDELPYDVAVDLVEMREEERRTYIAAVIWVQRDAQKAIVIGERGAMIRDLGTSARQSLERFLGRPVFLDLRVKLRSGWAESAAALQQLGYGADRD